MQKGDIRIGDRVAMSGGLFGTVVAVIHKGEFATDYPASEWAYLKRGLLIETEEAGLIHLPDCGEATLIQADPPP